jgi:hypothetical protein
MTRGCISFLLLMISLHTWERQMRHARELLRSVAVCGEEGQRHDLYNHTRICASSWLAIKWNIV